MMTNAEEDEQIARTYEYNMFEGVFYTDEQMESAHILMSGGMSIKDALEDVMGEMK